MGILELRTRVRFKVELLRPTISSMLRFQLPSRSLEVTRCSIPHRPRTLLLTSIPPLIPTPIQPLHRDMCRVRLQIRASMGIQHRFNRSSTPLPGLCSINIPKGPRLQPSTRLCSSTVQHQLLTNRPIDENPWGHHRSKRVLSSLLQIQQAMLLCHMSERLIPWHQLRS